jgi:type II secretory pathway predicted ATPase ExeA
MYQDYWNLSGKPFLQHTDSARFFRGSSHQAAILRLNYALDNLAGPGLVLGLTGTGKSSLVRVFADSRPAQRPVAWVLFPTLECDELLRIVAEAFNPHAASLPAGSEVLLRDIHLSLRKFAARELQPLICFDDAHLLSQDALQEVVLPLLALCESDAGIRLSMLLIGQPVLSSRVRKIAQLSERVSVTTPIHGFTASETLAYVSSCLNDVGGRAEIFSAAAVHRLFEVTSGNPRRINRLADMALLVGYAESLPQITEMQIEAVSAELMPAAA